MASQKVSQRELQKAREERAKKPMVVTFIEPTCGCPLYDFPHYHRETQPIREAKKL